MKDKVPGLKLMKRIGALCLDFDGKSSKGEKRESKTMIKEGEGERSQKAGDEEQYHGSLSVEQGGHRERHSGRWVAVA